MKFLSEKAAALVPYVPGEQPKDGVYIKLNTNENPYPPSPKALEAIHQAAGDRLRLYPDPESTALKQACAQTWGVKPSQVFVGNGSDEVLAVAFQAFFSGRKNVLMPDISYSFYPVYCNLYDVEAKEVPLKEDFSINVEAFLQPNEGVVIANPNAPTGMALSSAQLETIVKANPDSVVLIDEAYVDFGGESMVPLIEKYDNLLVVCTLSKSRSLAGLRVGFAFGSEALMDGMNRVKNSFNSYPVDFLAQKGAESAILDRAYFDQTRNKVIEAREWTAKELKRLGFDVLPSKANFVFAKPNGMEAAELFQKLKKEKILVRYFNKPRIDRWLRISIGTMEDMKIMIEKTEAILWQKEQQN